MWTCSWLSSYWVQLRFYWCREAKETTPSLFCWWQYIYRSFSKIFQLFDRSLLPPCSGLTPRNNPPPHTQWAAILVWKMGAGQFFWLLSRHARFSPFQHNWGEEGGAAPGPYGPRPLQDLLWNCFQPQNLNQYLKYCQWPSFAKKKLWGNLKW